MTTKHVGTLSSKGQITLPARVIRTLGLKPGDKLNIDVAGDHVEIRRQRPDVAALISQFAFHDETVPDAVLAVRQQRGWDDGPGELGAGELSAGELSDGDDG